MGAALLNSNVSLINSGLLVFFLRIIFDQGVCFGGCRFSWLCIF